MPDPADEKELLWYNPDPRAIIPLDGFHESRSFRAFLRKNPFYTTIDKDFAGVMRGCAERDDTWINADFLAAYQHLNEIGYAHSVEVWDHRDHTLVGGLYGVSLAGAFFAESKFHRATNASKFALFSLVNHMKTRGMSLLEVQFMTPHLESLGAVNIAKEDYLLRLDAALKTDVSF